MRVADVGGVLVSVARRMTRDRVPSLAAEMAFWGFFSLVPLAAVVGWGAARLVPPYSAPALTLRAAIPAEARQLVARQVNALAAWHAGTLAPLGVLTFLWLASGGIHAFFDALEVSTGTVRPWLRKRALAMGACVALSLAITALALGTAALGRVVPIVASLAVAGALGAALLVAIEAMLYRIGTPHDAHRTTAVFPGAVFAVAGQLVLGWGYQLYLREAGNGSAYLAGLAIVGVTLTTLWLFSVALLLGAELNFVVDDVRRRRAGPPG